LTYLGKHAEFKTTGLDTRNPTNDREWYLTNRYKGVKRKKRVELIEAIKKGDAVKKTEGKSYKYIEDLIEKWNIKEAEEFNQRNLNIWIKMKEKKKSNWGSVKEEERIPKISKE